MQVGEKERSYQMENVYKDIVRTIVDKCVDPATKKAYTTYTIERALRNIGFSVNLNKNVKSQALDAIKQLKKKNVIPIERARMRIRIVVPLEKNCVLKEELKQFITVVTDKEGSGEFHTVNIFVLSLSSLFMCSRLLILILEIIDASLILSDRRVMIKAMSKFWI